MDEGQPKPPSDNPNHTAAAVAPHKCGHAHDDDTCSHCSDSSEHRRVEGVCGHCACENHAAQTDDIDGRDDTDATADDSWRGDGAPTVDEPAPEEIDELALACIRFVHDALGVELDFTAETLPLLDHYLITARAELAEKPELRELVFRTAGAYFGELLRRRLNGYWQLPTQDTHTWRVCGRHVLLSINPVGVVAEAVASSESSEGPSGVLRLARADQADVVRRLAEIPPLPEDEFFLTSTRLEVIDVVVEHLRMRMVQNNQADMEFDLDDYATDLQAYGQA